MTTKTQNTFVGAYVNDVKAALVASALSAQHCLLIGAPGWGKSEIAMALASKIVVDPDRRVFLPLEASTQIDKVEGAPILEEYLDKGRIVNNVKGTAKDDEADIIILDELGRPHDAVFDVLIHAMKRLDLPPDKQPVFWGTTNFMPSSERTQALRERIALWVHIAPGSLNVRAISRAHMRSLGARPQLNGKIPTWADIEQVRQARPGVEAEDAVGAVVEQVAQEAMASGFTVNPRFINHWTTLLYRTGVFYSGDDNFSTVPAEASYIMQYAYPTLSYEEWQAWAEVATSVVDVVGSALNSLQVQTFDTFKKIMEEGRNNARRKSEIFQDLGEALVVAENNLEKVGGASDPRVQETMNEIMKVYSKAIQGGDPFGIEEGEENDEEEMPF